MRLLLLVLLGLALGSAGFQEAAAAQREADKPSIRRQLRSAENAPEPQATELRLDAARRTLAEGNRALAGEILALVADPAVSPEALRLGSLLQAELALADGQPDAAFAALNQPAFQALGLDEGSQVTIGRLRAGAYLLQQDPLGAARELIYVASLLPEEARQAHHDAILQNLLQLDAALLQAEAQGTATRDLRGWLSLGAALKQHPDNPVMQLDSFNDWLKVWPGHPASIQRPTALQFLPEAVRGQLQRLALILPLSGPLGSIGTAIRDGFIAAHYKYNPGVRLDFQDSHEGDLKELLEAAWAKGAQLVIGPLERKRVTEAARLALDTPVIALNRTEDGSVNPNLYQFGLAPEDESRQAAEQIVRDGRRNGLLIYPSGAWGARNARAFSATLEAHGGAVVAAAVFEPQPDYSELIKELLKVDDSEARRTALGGALGAGFEFVPRRRQDIDFVFLLANPAQARGLNPTLAFYYAEDLPRYATSHVHAFGDSRIDLIDMGGIRFCEMPFKLPGDNPTRAEVSQIWPAAAGNLAAFYALGLDVHRLYPRLQELKETGGRLDGATGVLSLTEHNIVIRHLAWAQFSQGAIERLALAEDQAP